MLLGARGPVPPIAAPAPLTAITNRRYQRGWRRLTTLTPDDGWRIDHPLPCTSAASTNSTNVKTRQARSISFARRQYNQHSLLPPHV